ncbi:hypothetical protein KDH_27440 [Dictyobacter sp. S3.2.2.5]|uniref:Uncharacterized protein n=1 Tax=Dictyobacter halimunensis TaxID=3026934 RepID=A0ABQ6FRH0_9CHLR|nr:hypothetical protein KDH_27440 [Dictyobacter sp. S3.2.2.5]
MAVLRHSKKRTSQVELIVVQKSRVQGAFRERPPCTDYWVMASSILPEPVLTSWSPTITAYL